MGDMDRGADLEVAVSITNQLKKGSNIGAGANANSKANMMQFVGSDALAELVWSPQSGLSIKFAEENPCFMGEVGPGDIAASENTRHEEHLASLAACRLNDKVVGCNGSQNRRAAYEEIFKYGMTSGDGSGSGSKPPLRIEPVMQCGPHEHAGPQDHGCSGETFLENAQVTLFDNIVAERQSCRAANLLTTRKRKFSFEQQLVLGTKQIKTQSDSSFINWISNTLKGLKKHNVCDPSVGVCNESRGLDTRTLGFHNVFHSLFSPETMKQIENKPVQPLHCERVTKEAPKEMLDTIRKLRLSRTDILKCMNSKSLVARLDGFYLRLRVAKCEEQAGGSRYYVARITGVESENLRKQSIRVKVGDVECFVQSQYISNCDFLEDELRAWWEETSKHGGIPVVKDLETKLVEKRRLGM